MHSESMASQKQTDGPGNAALAWRAAIAAHERAAGERHARANDRERQADEREALADRREHIANQREALADERERAADRREVAQNERQRQLDERARAPGWAMAGVEQRVLGTIERSRAFLALRTERVDRQNAAVKRSQAHDERQQAAVERAAARRERHLAGWQPDPSDLSKRAKVLRADVRAAIQAVAASEDEVARVHDELAATNPEHHGEYQQAADRARMTARHARDILHTFTD